MGRVLNYFLGDVLAGYKRLKGFHVLDPIGWDSLMTGIVKSLPALLNIIDGINIFS